MLKWKKIPNQIRNNSIAIADGRRDVGVCHLRRNRRDASHLLSHRVLCQKPSRSLINKARQRKMARMAADIQRVLRKEFCHMTGSKQDERVDDHLEKAMANYEELRQVDNSKVIAGGRRDVGL